MSISAPPGCRFTRSESHNSLCLAEPPPKTKTMRYREIVLVDELAIPTLVVAMYTERYSLGKHFLSTNIKIIGWRTRRLWKMCRRRKARALAVANALSWPHYQEEAANVFPRPTEPSRGSGLGIAGDRAWERSRAESMFSFAPLVEKPNWFDRPWLESNSSAH